MSIAVCTQKHIFGLRRAVANSIAYHDEQTVVYPAGSNTIMYNMDQKVQKFIPPGSDKVETLTAMAVSPNRRYIALAERHGGKAAVTIYDLHSLRKRKVLTSPEVQSSEFVSVSFSPDSKYLITQGGKPDWTLLYWAWEKSRVMAYIKTSDPRGSLPVYQVTFNPQDNTQICATGNAIFKLFRYSETTLRQFAFQKTEQNYLCQAWVSDERVVVGTDSGKLLIFEAGEVKTEINLVDLIKLDREKSDMERERTMTTSSEEQANDGAVNVTAIAAFSKGFACTVGPGRVFIFEKSEEKEIFKKTREIRIPEDQNTIDPAKNAAQTITSLAISPSEESLVCITDQGQSFSIALSSTELGKGEFAKFEFLAQSFHHGQVTGLDVCIRKPLIATCSLDHSVRIWNFETNNMELYKEFPEEAYSIALHPSGLYILVGFSDKLRLMNLLIDDIRPFKEFTIRGCRECSFANGGHLFAAVHGNIIQVYSTTTFETVQNLKGHNGKVKAVVWSQDDSRIVSCGIDGAVYEWETYTGKRPGESVLKTNQYTGVALSPEGKTYYAVGSDKTLKEISDCQVLREIDAKENATFTSVAMSHSGRMLFTGMHNGALRSIKFPVTTPGEWIEYTGHSSQIIKMKVTHDDQSLITISDDACVMIWKIQDREGRAQKRADKDIGYAEEILITKSDLEEKNSSMAELKTRVEELMMENDYQMRLKDMNYNEKIKELTEKFIQEMESLKTKNQVLKTEKEKQEQKQEDDVNDIMERHSKEVQDLESANNQKLMLEYEKYQELQTKSQKMQEDYERQLHELEEQKERELEEMTEFYEAKLNDMNKKLETANDEMREQKREYEETKRQIEEDADREILDIKNRYERRLKEEKDNNTKLKAETGILRKKFTSLNKEIEDHKEEIKKYQQETQKLNNMIHQLEKDIQGLKKEIQERDDTIQDKEKRIYDLKKKNQELEKFKFVLDYKIRELKKQIEPREKEIKNSKEQIQEMESELERFHKQNTQLELNISELKQKLKATEKEMHQERQKVRDVEAVVRRFRTDLHNCVGYIQDPKLLGESIRALYKKHVQDDITSEASVDADIQKEYARQREHLERSVASLRKKLVKDTEIHKADNVRIMQENVSLIKEINDLRKELKIARSHVHDLEAALGLHRKTNQAKATETLARLLDNNPNTKLELEVTDKNKIIDMQKGEIAKLRSQLREMELYGNDRPPSGIRLDPIETH